MGEIRIGKVSSVDYANGMIKVTYPDKDGATTALLPVLSLDGEYKMPDVDQSVLVVHLSNGNEAGVALGTFWNEATKSLKTGKGVFRKELSNKPGEAFMQYENGTLELNADKIKFTCAAGTITVAEIIAHIK